MYTPPRGAYKNAHLQKYTSIAHANFLKLEGYGCANSAAVKMTGMQASPVTVTKRFADGMDTGAKTYIKTCMKDQQACDDSYRPGKIALSEITAFATTQAYLTQDCDGGLKDTMQVLTQKDDMKTTILKLFKGTYMNASVLPTICNTHTQRGYSGKVFMDYLTGGRDCTAKHTC